MLRGLFFELRHEGVKASLREYLDLCGALHAQLSGLSVERFYALARCILVKRETDYDRFDRAFGRWWGTIDPETLSKELPSEWLRGLAELFLDPEDIERLQDRGGFDAILDELKKRLDEQKARHEGGNKWIGTRGTSPFGHSGAAKEGIRIGGKSRLRRAFKVWEQREYRNLDDSSLLGSRSFQIALRRLREFGREGAADQLDLDGTIDGTARNAGHLDLHFVPERRNTVKILMLLDVGGSMDDHIHLCERLFSAAKAEFHNLECYYFHNCVYEGVWRDNSRRHLERTMTWDLIRKHRKDWKLIFVGDASMSPYELTEVGGSLEHWNEETGMSWIRVLCEHFERAVWINPIQRERWAWTTSIEMVHHLMDGRMFPLTLAGLREALDALRAPR